MSIRDSERQKQSCVHPRYQRLCSKDRAAGSRPI
ncbi:hypothetical protein DDE20_16865 [Pararhodobacter oceanensis]|uniref:Uncharacterized protein n=1 Tax=Pararhodobacter oceanensis TaxID=2172121 RepID=A0A2T8HQA2_9RHOB|nr:hypothetical protein DDE20_16865 [Pararhodobacter oceanensis]